MAKSIHKGTEFSNINETWQQNERDGSNSGTSDDPALPGKDLQQVIKEEAAAYENENKADRVLPGERATVNDDQNNSKENQSLTGQEQ